MSQQFYDRFISVFFGFVVLLILVLASTELILFYISTQNNVFYVIYCGTLIVCLLYGTKYYKEFRDFQTSLYLLIPSKYEKPSNLESLSIDGLQETPLKVCLFYRNGASYEEIKQVLGLSHPTQVKRQLIKGLDILLRSYEKGEKKGSES